MTLRMNLPIGFEVELDRDTRVLDGGCALLGGSPIRLLRLTGRAAERLTLEDCLDTIGRFSRMQKEVSGCHATFGELGYTSAPAIRN